MSQVKYTPIGAQHVEEVAAWWLANRAGNTKFVDELERAAELLAAVAGLGLHFKRGRYRRVRRVLLRESEQNIYYVHDVKTDIVWIIAVWGAKRGKGPRLVLPT